MASNLIGNEAPLSGVAGSSPVSSAFSKRDSLSYDDRLRKESVFVFLFSYPFSRISDMNRSLDS